MRQIHHLLLILILALGTAVFATDYGAITVSDASGKNRIATIYGDTTAALNITQKDFAGTVVYQSSRFASGKIFTVTLPFTIKKGDKATIGGGTIYKFVDITNDFGNWTVNAIEATTNQDTIIAAHKPYIFVPEGTELTISGNGNNKIVLEATTNGAGSVDLGHNWTMCGTYSYKKWEDGDPEIGHVYGFAASSKDNVQVGQFVKVAAGAFIKPMRAYLYYNNANSGSAGRPAANGAHGGQYRESRPNASPWSAANGAHGVQYRENRPDASPWSAANGAHGESIASIDDNNLPETIGLKLLDENGETTAIGRMDTKTGEMRIDKWYDLKGRKMGSPPSAKGVYVNKSVKKIQK